MCNFPDFDIVQFFLNISTIINETLYTLTFWNNFPQEFFG